MSRRNAFLVHLSLSAAILAILLGIIFFFWYPQPYFEVVGAWYLVRILFCVAIVIGPLLTLIVFKPGKWGLKFDLWFIGVVQVAALVYGIGVIYQERPYYMVFSVNRFELVAKKDLDLTALRYDELRDKPWFDTVQVFARLPEDPEEASRFMDEVIFENKPDLERRPEYWHPYAENAIEATEKAKDIAVLLEEDAETAARASDLIDVYGQEHAKLGYLPLLGRSSDYSMILDMQTGEQLEIIDVNPYELMSYQEPKSAP
jgi:hypothetical protein